MEWIHDIPLWLFGVGTIVTFVSLSVLGLYIKHRSVRHLSQGAMMIDNGVVGWFFSGIMVLYSITLGLVAVATWQNMTQLSGISSAEAASIAALYRDVSGYPDPLKTQAQQELRTYTTMIIDTEWPAQRAGKINTSSAAPLNQLQQLLFAFEPTTVGQQVIAMEALRQYNILIELRRQRVEGVDSGIPGVLWVVVLGGAVICIVFSFAFQIDDFRLHVGMTAGLAITIGLLIFMVGALDQPYRGEVSVDSTAYKIILGTVMHQ